MGIEASWPEWSAVRYAVRQHKPSELLPALAKESYKLGDIPFDPDNVSYSQWSIVVLRVNLCCTEPSLEA